MAAETHSHPDLNLRDATTADTELVRSLFLEYAASLDFDLGFQNFEQELATLPGKYAPPGGFILLAFLKGLPVGCVALRPLSVDRCEMKRLYVRPAARKNGVGRALLEGFLHKARLLSYQSVVLDTIEPLMWRAIAMYKSVGFREIPPYCDNPVRGAKYLELTLEPGVGSLF